jgi:rhamnogalacturonyl hydrolase YesR
MFAYAMAVGVRNGWLDEKRFGPAVAKAWKGLLSRIDEHGNLAKTCIGTAAKASRE